MTRGKLNPRWWTICWLGKSGQLVTEQESEEWRAVARAHALREYLLAPPCRPTVRVVPPGGKPEAGQ